MYPQFCVGSLRYALFGSYFSQRLKRSGLPLVAEPARLEFAGFDRYRRPLWLLEPAARAWRRMRRNLGLEWALIHRLHSA